MPTYRLTDRQGSERTLQATRVVTDDAEVRFETTLDGRWRPVFSLPANDVDSLMRRVNEVAGWRWIRARIEPVPARP